MSTSTSALEGKDLQRLLSARCSGAILVPRRILRRIIKADRDISGPGLQVPHSKTYVIEGEKLLRYAHRSELGLVEKKKPPRTALLLPEPEWLSSQSNEETLVEYWRLLFHARLDQELQRQLDNGTLDELRAFQVIQQIGFTEFEEATAVLRQEQFLLPPVTPPAILAELIAVFFELRYFAPYLLHTYFPAMRDLDPVAQIFDEVVKQAEDPKIKGVESIYERTRLRGAPEPVLRTGFTEETPEHGLQALTPRDLPDHPQRCEQLREQAKEVTELGNVVRAAILLKRALDVAPENEVEAVKEEISQVLNRLVYRLHSALELHDKETDEWKDLLPALLEPASRGTWSVSARLLYDLQKVCVDYERDIFALDLGAAIRSLGRRDVKRFLPYYANVLLVKHLRTASSRLAKAPVGDEERRRLAIVLRAAVHHSEQRLRERLRPVITQVLDDVKLTPENFPEEVARQKLIEELLDRIAEWGFLTMSDVRDAISRNQIKLPDLSGPVEWLTRDQLLRIDHALSYELDGIYKRGELYLRLLQRLSSLLFGTRPGRALTRFVLLPFGGAFATIVFIFEMLHLAGIHQTVPPEAVGATTGTAALLHLQEEGLLRPPLELPGTTMAWLVGSLGLFYLLLIYVRPFRSWIWKGLCWIGKWLKAILFEWPFAFFQLPWVQGVLSSLPVVLFRKVLLRPLLLTGLVAVVCLLSRGGDQVMAWLTGGTFAISLVFFNSRMGRTMDEAVTDWALRNWDWLRADVMPGIFAYVMSFFKRCLDQLERLLYSVDEWMRFRTGDSQWSLLFKPILSMFWKLLTYVIRVIINLFVEPTFNPIKHFPVVTVAAKLLVPFFPLIHLFFVDSVSPILGVALSSVIEGLVIFFLPGLAGFIAWELKENWKLYASNRSPVLRPVVIGGHGETMKQFLKPGFHSGTLPRLYAKLRKAERQANGKSYFKHHEGLHHVMDNLRHFIERELLMLLHASKAWGETRLYVGMMNLATNRIQIEICGSSYGQRGFWLRFELQGGWLIAAVDRQGWLSDLKPVQVEAMRVALVGLYRLSGVDVVHEQVKCCLPNCQWYQFREDVLLEWVDSKATPDHVHPLRAIQSGRPAPSDFKCPPEQLLYPSLSIPWEEWIAVWKLDQEGKLEENEFARSARLLPGKDKKVPVS